MITRLDSRIAFFLLFFSCLFTLVLSEKLKQKSQLYNRSETPAKMLLSITCSHTNDVCVSMSIANVLIVHQNVTVQ